MGLSRHPRIVRYRYVVFRALKYFSKGYTCSGKNIPLSYELLLQIIFPNTLIRYSIERLAKTYKHVWSLLIQLLLSICSDTIWERLHKAAIIDAFCEFHGFFVDQIASRDRIIATCDLQGMQLLQWRYLTHRSKWWLFTARSSGCPTVRMHEGLTIKRYTLTNSSFEWLLMEILLLPYYPTLFYSIAFE